MYNITVGSVHPSVICVELSKLVPSLEFLSDLLNTEYIEEGMQEFIEGYARTDEVMPTDKTLGFVVVNSNKKVVSFSFANTGEELRKELAKASERFSKIGYTTDLDLQ